MTKSLGRTYSLLDFSEARNALLVRQSPQTPPELASLRHVVRAALSRVTPAYSLSCSSWRRRVTCLFLSALFLFPCLARPVSRFPTVEPLRLRSCRRRAGRGTSLHVRKSHHAPVVSCRRRCGGLSQNGNAGNLKDEIHSQENATMNPGKKNLNHVIV